MARPVIGKLAVLFALLMSTAALACKMTPMGSASAAIHAVLQQVSNQTPDREIKAVRKVKTKDSAWTYVVEATDGGKACQAKAYRVQFEPNCRASVEVLTHRLTC